MEKNTRKISFRYSEIGDFVVVQGQYGTWSDCIFVRYSGGFINRILGITFKDKINKAVKKMNKIIDNKQRKYLAFCELDIVDVRSNHK